jgi:hypothetical protein
MESKHAFAFVGGIILAPIFGFLGFFYPFFNSTFTILVISILLGVGLGYAYHCLMKWLPEGHSFVVMSLLPMIGVMLGSVPIPLIKNIQMQTRNLMSSTDGLAAGGGLMDLFTGPDPLWAIPILLLSAFIASYWIVFPKLKAGDKKDLLWLLLPLVAAAIAIGIGWFLGAFLGGRIMNTG